MTRIINRPCQPRPVRSHYRPPPPEALDFRSSTAYVTFGEANPLKLAQFTLEGWFKREEIGTTANTGTGGFYGIPLITKGVGEAEGSNVDMNYFLGIHGTNNVICADFEEGSGGAGPAQPESSGMWHHNDR